MSDVKFVTFVSGTSVLCKCEESSNGSSWILKKPVRLMQTPEGLSLTPMNPFAEHEEVTVSKKHVMFIETPQPSFIQDYEQHFGSGLVLNTSLVTP